MMCLPFAMDTIKILIFQNQLSLVRSRPDRGSFSRAKFLQVNFQEFEINDIHVRSRLLRLTHYYIHHTSA